MGQSQDATETAREYETRRPVMRRVAPGVYFASDGMLTADSLDCAIAYLRGVAESDTEGQPAPNPAATPARAVGSAPRRPTEVREDAQSS